MLDLDAVLAQAIVDRTMQIVECNVNVMDGRGVIIASGDRDRIGTQHEGALLVLAQGRSVEIDDALAARLRDARPGVNLPLRTDGRIVGVVGLTGAPDAMRRYAELVRMAAETMLEQARLIRLLARDARLREELVLQLIGIAPAAPALDDWARRLGVDLELSRVAVSIALEADALPADAALAAQQRVQAALAAAGERYLVAPVSLRELVVLMPVPGVRGEPPGVTRRRRAEALLARAREAGGVAVRIATGGCFAGPGGLARSYQSARATLRVGRQRDPQASRYDYGDMTLAVLLAELGEGWQADELRAPLERLAAHDRNGQLRRALAAWFAHDMNTAAAAKALHLHRNTLDYRLRRISDATGLDLSRLDDCLLLYIGLQLTRTD
jgi:carbohydrate diacid regulator